MLHYTLAYCHDKLGDTESAKRQRALAQKNKIVEAFPIRHGEITVLKAALEANGKDGFAAYLLGCQLYNARMYDEASRLWENAVANERDFYIPYRNLALVYYNHLDRTSDAISLLRRAIELKPKDHMLLSEIASVMLGREATAWKTQNF